MITLGDGQVWYTKGKVSLDLRLADGMSFKRFLVLTMWDSTSQKMGSNLKRFMGIQSYNSLLLRM